MILAHRYDGGVIKELLSELYSEYNIDHVPGEPPSKRQEPKKSRPRGK